MFSIFAGLKTRCNFHRKEIFRPEKLILIIQFHYFLSFLVLKVNDFNSKFLLSRELLKIKRAERLCFPLAWASTGSTRWSKNNFEKNVSRENRKHSMDQEQITILKWTLVLGI